MESAYRTSILNWCAEIEQTWKSVRDQLDVDETKRAKWEKDFYAFKQEVEENNRFLQDVELQRSASHIYQSLSSFMTGNNESSEPHQEEVGSGVPIGGHTLPPLPYPYDALEPVISEEIMRLHHDVHHQGYVDGLNKAEKKMQEARTKGDFDLIKHWEREAAFNGSGHYLHTIFWDIMSPDGGGKPSGSLLAEIKRSFGSFDAFKKHFSEAAKKVEAVGWAILVWAPRAHRLEILTAEKHQNLTQWDTIPLLVLDVWEHAYYLQYKTKRGDYVDNWWKVVNWPAVEKRFEEAKKLKWEPF
ncbi:superoxide dismutase [Radiobacillus deserti]|uniref:superoxide dismutase n=2 Tax=Radiobacillus deserti TaxID=2594883 RepID=A0A516KLL6_9BACI|nr:superoxide dismutase [Radiobacillus deserti]QDP42267.1 superoxide dismutase [Radiobacillus deserti]